MSCQLTREEVQQWNIVSYRVDLVPLSQCCTCPCTNGSTNQLHIMVVPICIQIRGNSSVCVCVRVCACVCVCARVHTDL